MKKMDPAQRRGNVERYERNRAKALQSSKSIALGFAWRAPNIGGVRRHLESIEKYSSLPIALYPSTYANEALRPGEERKSYHRALPDGLIDHHDLFHSHVDPRFIERAQQAQQAGKPWVHTYHLLYFSEDWNHQLDPRQVVINDCLLQQARQADKCLTVGSWLVDWLEENHGIESSYLPNGVDVDACDRSQADRFTEAFGFQDFVLFVNSIKPVKNPLEFIEVARKFPELTFVMIGTDLTREEIEKNLGVDVPPNLKPLGPLPHNQALDAIAACRVFVMTSLREGLPTVLLEAMSMKKACVVPDAPWFNDAIPSAEYGLKYERGDLEDLARAIETAMDARPYDAARRLVETTFSWPVIMRQLDRIYLDLLG